MMAPDIKNGWITTSINIRINSFDQSCGINEIHYILYGKENIVYNTQTNVMIEKNGIHKFVYWAVDTCGNEEVPNLFCFKIDTGEPTIKIIRPEPGLYLFGKKMDLSTDKLIFIGGFDIEVDAYDNVSGLYNIQYFLNDDLINEATNPPFNRYCGVRHVGKGTITVVAWDFCGHASEDSIDIIYFNPI
jgi:hypothetical protein